MAIFPLSYARSPRAGETSTCRLTPRPHQAAPRPPSSTNASSLTHVPVRLAVTLLTVSFITFPPRSPLREQSRDRASLFAITITTTTTLSTQIQAPLPAHTCSDDCRGGQGAGWGVADSCCCCCCSCCCCCCCCCCYCCCADAGCCCCLCCCW